MQEVNQDETSKEAERKTQSEMIQVICCCGHSALKSRSAKYVQEAFVWLGHPYNPGFNLFRPEGHSDHDVCLTAVEKNCSVLSLLGLIFIYYRRHEQLCHSKMLCCCNVQKNELKSHFKEIKTG